MDGTALRAGVQQHEAAGAIGVLGHAGGVAGLAEQGGLLVAGDAGDRDWRAEDVASCSRRRRARKAERAAAVRAGRGTVRAARRPSRRRGCRRAGCARRCETSVTCTPPPVSFQTSQLSTVPKASSPRSARSARAGHVVEQPRELGGGEIGIEHQAGLLRTVSVRGRARFRLSQASAVRRSCQTMALCTGCAGGAVPHHRGLALVGDADRGDVRVPSARPAAMRARAHARAATTRSPPGRARPSPAAGRSGGIPAAPTRRMAPSSVEHDRARTGGALVECEDVFHRAVPWRMTRILME